MPSTPHTHTRDVAFRGKEETREVRRPYNTVCGPTHTVSMLNPPQQKAFDNIPVEMLQSVESCGGPFVCVCVCVWGGETERDVFRLEFSLCGTQDRVLCHAKSFFVPPVVPRYIQGYCGLGIFLGTKGSEMWSVQTGET